MSYIEHIIEPRKLLLSWQSPEGGDRRRHLVAELRRRGDDADLLYLRESKDYADAKAKGFDGEYPGFPAHKDHTDVLAAFMRRLPPRQRGDFDKFLEAIRIPRTAAISDFAMLGYAGARLPGDDFSIIHPFDDARPPFELLLLVAGYRYYQANVPRESLKPGMLARFELEPGNPHDPDAVRVVIPDVSEHTAGYVCQGLLPQFRRWIVSGMHVEGTLDRLNGTAESPLVYLFVTVRQAAPPLKAKESATRASG
ncbi:hypothetical protein LCGC14_2794520 [marine sediment metagenome]|uniref:HIRAN domain-containing protein n=1 Tax=marine sediment metagenome TaxID=412755 RepID=A0A0F8ZBK8_9ZZZZ